jgi:phosphoribosylformylglycinamidine cyclo-ligase
MRPAAHPAPERPAARPVEPIQFGAVDSYARSGVDYEVLDQTKRVAGAAAAASAYLLPAHGAREVAGSRGQSAYVFEFDGTTLAFVLECLGTKSLVAQAYQDQTGENRWADVAKDTVAAVVNDIVSVGALPLVVNAYFATGSDDWFARPAAMAELVRGWAEACAESGAAWGGGETPTLRDLVTAGAIELAGSCVGYVPAGRAAILGDALRPGDEIILVASSGLHANGASLARRVAGRLPDGLAAALPSGHRFGAALLTPSVNYTGLVRALLAADLEVSYLAHLTGHGWRKIMRAEREFRYVLTALPEVPEVLTELVRLAAMPPEEAYGTFNMGAGFAVMCRPEATDDVLRTAAAAGYAALRAGTVQAGERSVVIEPLGLRYPGDTLQLR